MPLFLCYLSARLLWPLSGPKGQEPTSRSFLRWLRPLQGFSRALSPEGQAPAGNLDKFSLLSHNHALAGSQAWPSLGDGQPVGAQGEQGARADRGKGRELLYLLPYSPDLNSIE